MNEDQFNEVKKYLNASVKELARVILDRNEKMKFPQEVTKQEPLISNLDFNTLIVGKTEEEAKTICSQMGFIFRVTIRDNKPHVVTMDLKNNRVNVSVLEGKVVYINGIG